MLAIYEGVVPVLGVLVALLVVLGMLGPFAGGSMSLSVWFTWHPILMSLAFPCLMVSGKWVYVAEGYGETSERRSAHRVIMVLAWASTVVGYFAIFVAHLPKRQFFGYDFIAHEWKPSMRVVHVFVGYLAVLLVLVQAPMGLAKFERLREYAEKIFTFHGSLGNFIIASGVFNVCNVCVWWGWPMWLKLSIGGVSLLAAILAFTPRSDFQKNNM